MSNPIIRHQDPFQVGMPLETDPHQVKALAFVPIRGRLHGRHGGYHRFISRQAHFQANTVSSLDRKQVIIHFETRFQRKSVNGRKIGKKRKAYGGLRQQEFSYSPEFFFRDDHRRFAPEFNHFGDGLGVPLAKFLDYWVFILFLRFQLASDSGWALLIPVECALFPEINISNE